MVWSGGDEAGALGDGDEGADVVEEIDEEEDEDDLEDADVERAGDVEVEGGGFDRRQIVGSGLPVDLMAEDAEEGGRRGRRLTSMRGCGGLAGRR